ncbi:hypothetical protein GQ43DRAFT_442626 [Delitschia confertaspora ATCC 74209]|uniref:5-nitroimidazole antibiotic resistance protein n=1 Tax=Delitschia confertaspora ATCC 74209 TaxID=1513339 RepID=A0A9P4JHJ8_9PLEO|nr:hypothetical protein GQ43DRAFT_442626 [Delitschia confertaspora ATCC 74209]
MSTPPKYPKTSLNTVKRIANRGKYDYSTIHSLLNSSPIIHVSFNDPHSPFPITLPMIGCTGNFEDQDADPNTSAQDVYVHGYVSSRLMKLGSSSKSSEHGKGEGEQEEGFPLSISTAEIQGLVLALSPNHHSLNYTSTLIMGYATPVTRESEKLYAMQRITNNLLPGRWENSRQPPLASEMSSTSILRVRVVSASAKVRTGGPSEDRVDLGNDELRRRVWTGVVPTWRVWGEAVKAEECQVVGEEQEKGIEAWRVGENMRGRGSAFRAAVEGDGGEKE